MLTDKNQQTPGLSNETNLIPRVICLFFILEEGESIIHLEDLGSSRMSRQQDRDPKGSKYKQKHTQNVLIEKCKCNMF